MPGRTECERNGINGNCGEDCPVFQRGECEESKDQPMSEPIRDYLGDSVYAEVERGMICLTTANGYGPTNKIYLEPEVYEALVRFAQRAWPMEAQVDAEEIVVPGDDVAKERFDVER